MDTVVYFFDQVTVQGLIVGVVLTFIISFAWEAVESVAERRHRRKQDRLSLHKVHYSLEKPFNRSIIGLALEDIDEGGEGDVRIYEGERGVGVIRTHGVTRDVKAGEALKRSDLELIGHDEGFEGYNEADEEDMADKPYLVEHPEDEEAHGDLIHPGDIANSASEPYGDGRA
jgi:hypothetical protein